jgi:hypothetical protein
MSALVASALTIAVSTTTWSLISMCDLDSWAKVIATTHLLVVFSHKTPLHGVGAVRFWTLKRKFRDPPLLERLGVLAEAVAIGGAHGLFLAAWWKEQ